MNLNFENAIISCNGVFGIPMSIDNYVAIKTYSPLHHQPIEQLNATCTINIYVTNGMLFILLNFLIFKFN